MEDTKYDLLEGIRAFLHGPEWTTSPQILAVLKVFSYRLHQAAKAEIPLHNPWPRIMELITMWAKKERMFQVFFRTLPDQLFITLSLLVRTHSYFLLNL